MSDYLDAIASRAEDARRNRESYSKESCSRRITQEDSAKDVPRLLAAVRAVEELAEGWGNIGYPATREQIAALRGAAALIRRALTEALEDER